MTLSTVRWIIVVVVVAVVALLIGLRLGDRDVQAPLETPGPVVSSVGSGALGSDAQVAARNHRIELTGAGVSVRSLTIAAGDTVTFINATNGSFWPASDPHPTHDQCPGFDARRVLRRGESYILQFAAGQACGFHDHTDAGNVSRQGTITVR